MPAKYKVIISVLVALLAFGTYHFQTQAGQEVTPWIALSLGAFMIFAIWLFPETKNDK